MSLEHEAGCPELDMGPMLKVLGTLMIFTGVCLFYFGPKIRMSFMRVFITVASFLIVIAVFFKLNWLAMIDPTEPDKNKSVFLTGLAFIAAFTMSFVMYWLWEKTK